MPDQEATPDPADHYRQHELEIIYLLTDPDDNQPLWTLEDLARELDEPEAIIYVRRLQEAGLVHRTSDGHVFASRAAVRQVQLVGHNVS
jgi:Mn-dependent DtxR family transcriptional regulator